MNNINKTPRKKQHQYKNAQLRPFLESQKVSPINNPSILHPSLRRGCRSIIGDGNDASQMIQFRPSRPDLGPIAEKFSAPFRRVVSLLIPNTITGSTTVNLTVGDLINTYGISEAIQIEKLEMQAVGAKVASFQVFQFVGNEQLSTSLQDCAPPNAWPGVEVAFAMGARPTFSSSQTAVNVAFVASSEVFKLYVQATLTIQI